jgi:hypothetical protein
MELFEKKRCQKAIGSDPKFTPSQRIKDWREAERGFDIKSVKKGRGRSLGVM